MKYKGHKVSRAVFILLSFCLPFSLLSGPLHAWETGPNPISSIDEVHKAVWKIQNFAPGVSFDSDKGKRWGTAFAINNRYFITNVHVWRLLLLRGPSLENIYLLQKGNKRVLRVHKLLAVSGIYDLALFETKESVENYLGLAMENELEGGKPFSFVGYPEGKFLHTGQLKGTRHYEDAWLFGYGIDPEVDQLGGFSGSPMLKGNEAVVGVAVGFDRNVIYGVHLEYVKKFLSSEIGTICSLPFWPGSCLTKEKEEVIQEARRGNKIAQFQLGRKDSHVNETEQDWSESVEWLRRSADQRFPIAMTRLALLEVEGKRGVKRNLRSAITLLEKASARNYVGALTELAEIYFNGILVKSNDKKALDLLKKALHLHHLGAIELLAKMEYEDQDTDDDI